MTFDRFKKTNSFKILKAESMLLSERIVIWTIWALTAVGGFFSLRRLVRRKHRK